jgi:membrane fusion protein (multidrug efflux system)
MLRLFLLLKKHRPLTIVVSAFSIVLIITICTLYIHNQNTNTQEAKVVETTPAILNSIQQSIRLIGTVKANKSTIFTAKVIGTLEKVLNAGQHANKLDLIAKLENADLEHSVLLSEDAVKLAKEQYDKYTLVFAKSNAISQKSLDDAKAAWITAQKALATAKQELDQTKFIAPFAGIVGVYKIRDGSQVTQGEQILTFYDPNEIIIEFNIPANYLKQINNGQTVIIGNKLLHIEHIQKMVDPNTNMSPAIVDYPCENCFIGENIDVDLIVAKKNNVLVIPSSAVFLKNGVTSVYIVENNKAILKPVTTGLQEKEQIEIIEGIKELDVVIVCGQSRLYPFAKVKIFQAEK